jgi:peptide/nickel transport system substrate-binding protein
LTIAVALALSSCQPAAVEEEGKTITGKVVEKEAPVKEKEKEVVLPAEEKPTYGGTLNLPLAGDIVSFEPSTVYSMIYCNMIYDRLFHGDFTASESEWTFYGIYIPPDFMVGNLCESYEEPDPRTFILHLKKGLNWQNLPPVNGREFTADDVVYSFNRLATVGQYAGRFSQFLKSVEALDKYTVEVKWAPADYPDWLTWMTAGNTWVVAREVDEKYGDLKDPLVQVGTGPYIIDDYVPGTSLWFKKNPDYWGKDPRYPTNRLPYIEKINYSVIADESTRLAALRTGKIDRHTAIAWDQADSLIQSNPELKYREILGETFAGISVRTDLEPFNDIRVRKALSMAVDHESIRTKYYKGHAEDNFPIPVCWKNVYIPVKQLPESIQEIMSYNPDKARELLAEAGYPNGFKFEVQVSNLLRPMIDVLQLMKEWYKDVGVDMEINVMENAAYISVRYQHTYPQASAGVGGISSPTFAFSWLYQPEGVFRVYNVGCVKDPVYNEKYLALLDVWTKDPVERDKVFKDIYLYTLENCWAVTMPYPNTYTFWQPWLKGGYWGQTGMSYTSSGDMYKYMWLDMDLKKQISGRS